MVHILLPPPVGFRLPEGLLPSPVGHSLAGLTIAHLLAPKSAPVRVSWYAFAVVAANAPDFDFVGGLAVGAINAFHGGIAHSFGAAFAVAGLTALALRGAPATRWRASAAALALYASHILLDMACNQSPENQGMPVLWPVTTDRMLFEWRPLWGILHGGTYGGVRHFLAELFSVHNLMAIGIELAVFLPLLGLALYVWPNRGGSTRTEPATPSLGPSGDD